MKTLNELLEEVKAKSARRSLISHVSKYPKDKDAANKLKKILKVYESDYWYDIA